MMKTLNYLFLSLCLLLMTASCSKKPDSSLPAKLVYEQTDQDLGSVIIEDGTRVVKYTIRNDGGHYIYLADVVSSCDCTKIDFSRDNLWAGEKTTIKVTFDPKDLPEGDFERMIGVYTNMKQRPDTLYFHGVAKHK